MPNAKCQSLSKSKSISITQTSSYTSLTSKTIISFPKFSVLNGNFELFFLPDSQKLDTVHLKTSGIIVDYGIEHGSGF